MTKFACLLPVCLFVISLYGQSQPATADHGGSTPASTDTAPQIFAPNVISGPANDGAPTFTPDGTTMFFTRSGATWGAILESHQVGDHWSEPEIAPFSGEWSDLQPVLSHDGSYLIFSSWRPAEPHSTSSADKGTPVRAAYLWRVDRAGSGWGQPVRLPDTVNFTPHMFKPTLAADGSIYFMAMEKGKKFRLFRSQYQNGNYQKAEPLSFSDGTTGDVDPEIAPDESFLFFSSDSRTPGDSGHEHLFVVFKKAEGWSAVTPVHFTNDNKNDPSNDNEAHLSRDLRTIYFASDRSVPVKFPRTREQAKQDLARVQTWDNNNYNVWFVQLSPLLDAAKSGSTTPAS
jgi:Tol biopolymer transport system component